MNPICGPYGGEGGADWDDGSNSGVKQLSIVSGSVINSIRIEYVQDGRSFWSDKHGGDGGGNTHKVRLDYPDEYLTSFSGYRTTNSDFALIQSLTIQSNKRTYGPFGVEKGRYFSFPSDGGKIIGFHGRSDHNNLHSIGAYLEPTSNIDLKSMGPFGGEDYGTYWHDGKFSTIRQITINYGSVINSIRIEYDNNGSSVWSPTHGRGCGENTNMVKVDYPSEYLTSISGYYRVNSSPVVIQSLTFQSNRRIFGPFGMEKGRYFSSPSTRGKIIGFYGSSDASLNSIGAYLEPISSSFETVGPFGGEGGNSWDDEDFTTVRQIKVVSGPAIVSISIEYDNKGRAVRSPRHGGGGGGNIYTINLDSPDEFLTSISGYYSVESKPAIKSLTFQSNRRIYGPFGVEQGKFFSFPSFNGKIVGFHGRCGDLLNSIGAHVEPISNPNPTEFVGPFGGQGGDLWDDGIYSTVRQLKIVSGSAVNSIRFEYDKNGRSVWSPTYGQNAGGKLNVVKLDFPDEFLISFSGYYSTEASFAIVQSLSFQSNRNTYGPFGTERGNYFSLQPTGGKIIGFHGRSDSNLHSIGAYLNPIPMPCSYEHVGPWGGQGGVLWDDGIYTTIRQLTIVSGSAIDSIQLEYDKHGRSIWSPQHGKNDGGERHKIKLDYPGEFLISMSGYFSAEASLSIVQSLTFQSNRKTYGPFGIERGNRFSLPSSTGGKIIGFHGRSGGQLDSIGVYLESISNLYPSEIVGPFGGQEGALWDDGVYSTIRQIKIAASLVIESICFEYDKNGRSVWTPKHGDSNDGTLTWIELDYPGEYLISISGYYSTKGSFSTVQSLTFESNRRTFGPFGVEKGEKFSLPPNGGKIIGFHGRSGQYLDSIGVYLEPISNS